VRRFTRDKVLDKVSRCHTWWGVDKLEVISNSRSRSFVGTSVRVNSGVIEVTINSLEFVRIRRT
jgi:hypothetical protein